MKFQYDLLVEKRGLQRNDPCPCGSGKKFKKCCIWKPFEPSQDLLDDFALGQRLIEENGGHYKTKPTPQMSKILGMTLLTSTIAMSNRR